MLVTEIPGLRAAQKEILATNFGVERQDGPPFEDDRPTHTVTLQGIAERRAAISGVLACDYTHPETLLLHKAGVALAELQRNRQAADQVVLWPERQGDESVIAAMYWTAHYADKVGSLTLSAIAERDNETARLAAFVGGEAEFASGLEIVRSSLEEMEAVGVLDEIDPDHVHNLPLPEPKIAPRFSPGTGFHLGH